MKKVFLFSLIIFLSGCSTVKVTVQEQSPDAFREFCFVPGQKYDVEAVAVTTTPESYLIENEGAQAAINGVYYAADDGLPQGIVWNGSENIASGKGLVSGGLGIQKGKVLAFEETPGLEEFDFFIGTHPLLLIDGIIHQQALEDRYNIRILQDTELTKSSFRSAIGTKDGQNLCFAVSNDLITMEEWARLLLSGNYLHAINLDGGPISQLAIRGEGVFGGGGADTRLILSAHNRQ